MDYYICRVFAIVDIETTGGFASSNGITEIAIILHNGREVEGYYSTLINPRQLIPRYVTALTGISNDMVAAAPVFEEVAETVNNLLNGRVFVAHNVNFDYSFIKQHLENCGYPFELKKLCTVRIARKLYSGLPSYSLGNLCRSLGIDIQNRHRAEGDARATATLFDKMLRDDEKGAITSMMKGRSAEQYLPPNLPLADIQALPYSPGVYYFENEKKEVIYVGKAVNLQSRVKSHFSNNDGSRRKQELLRQVHHIRYLVKVYFWTSDFDSWVNLKSKMIKAIYNRFGEKGINIPFPQQDLHIRSVDIDVLRRWREFDGTEEENAK